MIPRSTPAKSLFLRWLQPRFSLRTLFFLVTLCGLAGWYYTRCEQQRVAIESLVRNGGRVSYERVEIEDLFQDSPFEFAEGEFDGNTQRTWSRYLWETPQAVHFSSGSADVDLEALSHLRTVRSGRFDSDRGSPTISAFGLQKIEGHRALRILEFGRAPGFGDEEAIQIGKLSNLQALQLSSTRIGDSGGQALLALPSLRWLVLNESRVTDAAFAGKLPPQLERLDISRTHTSDATLSSLTQCAKLNVLDASETDITDAGLSSLAQCTNLKVLVLYHSQVTDAGVKSLSACKNLTELNVSCTKVSDLGVAQLSSLPLEKLNLCEGQVTDAALVHLAKLSSLRELYLYHTRVTADGVAAFRQQNPACEVHSSY